MLVKSERHSTYFMLFDYKRYFNIFEEVSRNIGRIRVEGVCRGHKHFCIKELSYQSIIIAFGSDTLIYSQRERFLFCMQTCLLEHSLVHPLGTHQGPVICEVIVPDKTGIAEVRPVALLDLMDDLSIRS